MVGEVYGAVQGGSVGEGVLRKEKKEEHWVGSPGSWHKRFLSSHPVPGSASAKKRKKRADKGPALKEEHASEISLCTHQCAVPGGV